MKLRSQMLLASAMTLIVPVVGWQSSKQLYLSLQQTRIEDQSQTVANMRLALTRMPLLAQSVDEVTAQLSPYDLYAEDSAYPLFLDGYADDWKPLIAEPVPYVLSSGSAHERVDVRAARRDNTLMLHVTVRDDSVVYHEIPVFRADAGEGELPDRWTQLANGDSVELLIEDRASSNAYTGIQHGVFRAIAPGPLTALQASDAESAGDVQGRRAGAPINGWQAYWQTAPGGFQLEVHVPLPASGSQIALAVVDVDERGVLTHDWSGSVSPQTMARWHSGEQTSVTSGRLFFDIDAIESLLQSWTSPGIRIRLFDQHGRQIGDVNKLYAHMDLDEERAEAEAFSSNGVLNALLFRVFSFFVAGDLPLLPEDRPPPASLALSAERRSELRQDMPVTSRYVTEENDRVLGSLTSLDLDAGRAYLLYEANEEHSSAYAGSQVARLFTLLLLVSLLAGAGLLIFALVLSSRISRLSQQAQSAFTMEGRVQGLSESDARDEIGDLSRKLSGLLTRSAAYTGYLEALSSRLSHELRTPLSVVRTSLENIDSDKLDEETRILVSRADDGAVQLGRIIKALVDSTRLEQIVSGADKQLIDVGQWLLNCVERYAPLYPDIRIAVSPPSPIQATVMISPDLLQQALDKLVANAMDFSQGEKVILRLFRNSEGQESRVTIAVANRGPAIDESLASELFNPLISKRQRSDGELHLGLGLYVVRLVAEASGGQVFVRNNNGWVEFGMTLPLAGSARLVSGREPLISDD